MILCQVKLNQIKIHLEINVTESVFHFVLCIYDTCDQKEKTCGQQMKRDRMSLMKNSFI